MKTHPQQYEVRHTLDGATGIFEIMATSPEDAIEQVKRQLVFVDGDWRAQPSMVGKFQGDEA